MRIFALSDIHVDHPANAQWIRDLSLQDLQDDVLLLAGDVSDALPRFEACLTALALRFRHVLYVPGNHELWTLRDAPGLTSFAKFDLILKTARRCGALTEPLRLHNLTLVPLLSWYDYSFGLPGPDLRDNWMDFHACRWPDGFTDADVADHFLALNEDHLAIEATRIISFSHFLPRIDVMPPQIPDKYRYLYPVLGSARLDRQIRRLGSQIHVYGHSHVNRQIQIDGVTYINNAFGYPRETRIAAKALLQIVA